VKKEGEEVGEKGGNVLKRKKNNESNSEGTLVKKS
jgi:hypothetical protein